MILWVKLIWRGRKYVVQKNKSYSIPWRQKTNYKRLAGRERITFAAKLKNALNIRLFSIYGNYKSLSVNIQCREKRYPTPMPFLNIRWHQWGQSSFSHLLNSNWTIQIIGARALCKEHNKPDVLSNRKTDLESRGDVELLVLYLHGTPSGLQHSSEIMSLSVIVYVPHRGSTLTEMCHNPKASKYIV